MDNQVENSGFSNDPLSPLDYTPSPKKSGINFVGGVLAIGGGAVLAQTLGIATIPVISRLFLPEAFGIAALFMSFVAVIQIFATLRYEVTIVLPARDKDAASILALCFINVTLISFICAIVVAIFGEGILRALNADELIPYRWLIPINVFVIGLTQPLVFWNTRNKHFKLLGIVRVVVSAGKSLGTIGSGLVGFTTGGQLIVIRLLAAAIGPVIYLINLVRHDLKFISRNSRPGQIWFWAKRYHRFPLLDSWTALLNIFSLQVSVMVLSAYFGERVTGLYAQCLLLMQLPSGLVGAAISQVSLQRFAQQHASGIVVTDTLERLYKHMFSLGVFPFALICLIGPDLFGTILGSNWVDSGVYARFLAPWLLFNYIYAPLSNVIYVLEKQRANLFFSIILISSRLGALFFGVLILKDPLQTIISYGLINLILYLSISVYLLKCAEVSFRSVLRNCLVSLSIAMPLLAVIFICKWVLGFSGLILLVVAGLLSIIYFVIVILRTQDLKNAATGIIQRVFFRERAR